MQTVEFLVLEAMSGLEDHSMPEALKQSIDQHRRHLVSLATALVAGGQSEEVVRQSVEIVFSSYREKLVQTIMAMKATTNAC